MNEPVELVAVVVASLCAVASVATFGLQVRLVSTAAYVVPMILPPRAGAPAARGPLRRRSPASACCCSSGLLLATARRSQMRLAEVFSLRLLTDRISAERAHALEQARRQSLVKTEFLAAMSHELRTPLHGILGLTRAAARRQHDDAELRHRLGLIEHSGEHLLQLINDLHRQFAHRSRPRGDHRAGVRPARRARGADRHLLRARQERKGSALRRTSSSAPSAG